MISNPEIKSDPSVFYQLRQATNQRISWACSILVSLLSLAAFGLSFGALKELAVTHGSFRTNVAWLFPIIIDGGIVVFSLAALRASLSGGDRRWYMRLVVIVTLFSVGLNIAHATKGIIPGVMAAMPPLLLFMAFESLMRQIHESVPAQVVKTKAKGRKEINRASEVITEGVGGRKAQALAMFSEGASKNKIARELQIAPSTVRRYLAALPDAK